MNSHLLASHLSIPLQLTLGGVAGEDSVKWGFYLIYFALILHFWGSSCSRNIKNKSSSPLKEKKKKIREGRKDHLHLPNPIRHPYPALWRSLSGSEWPPASSSSACRLAAHSSFTQTEAAEAQILVPPADNTHTALQQNFQSFFCLENITATNYNSRKFKIIHSKYKCGYHNVI